MERYELIIVGGGMSGLTLLASIHPSIKQGLKVAVIDPAISPTPTGSLSPSFDDRATALSAQAINTLTALNMANFESALNSIETIEVSDMGHGGFHTMTPQSPSIKKFGGVISNRVFGECLNKHTADIPADRFNETEVLNVQPTQEGQILSLSSGVQVIADLVILCEGGRSSLAENVGLSYKTHNFDACARVASVKTIQPHQGVAFERFTKFGPVAFLPFGEFSTMVWTVPNHLRADLPNTPETAIPWLNEHFGQRLGRITEISPWTEYPLQERLLSSIVAHGIIALGNTAATLHPVAGQGFNLAIRGINRTAALINQQFNETQSIPTFKQLSSLAEAIMEDQSITAKLSKELIQVFGSSNPIVQLGRGIGLNSLDRHPTLSQIVAYAGMGYLANSHPQSC
jgi:2-octaprenyl-6-methoxyphenol hydroxylase